MNYNFHLKKIGKITQLLVQEIADELSNFIFLKNNFFRTKNMLIYDYPDSTVNKSIMLVVNELSNVLNTDHFYSASIDCMLPASYIKEHVDQGVYGTNQSKIFDLHKIHIPIITNPYAKQIWIDCSNNILDHKIEYLEQGSAYAYNNTIPHCAINLGDTPRYHVVLRYKNLQEYDWMTNG